MGLIKEAHFGIGVNVIGIILSMITIKVIWDYSKAEKAYIDLAGRINLNEDEPQADDTSPENYDNNTNDLE